MLGAGFQLTRGLGEDRFNHPVKARRSHRNHRTDQLRRAQSDVSAGQSEKPAVQLNRESENRSQSNEPPAEPEPRVTPLSNLEQFLRSVTPLVPAQYPSKTTIRDRRTCEGECRPYFVLEDLWETFAERSAYGVGVPLVLKDKDSVVQYYVPFLSGIQLYADPCTLKSSFKLRRPGDDSDCNYRDSSSDGSSESELDRGRCYSRAHICTRMDRMSLGDQHSTMQEDSSSDDGESVTSQGRLIFEYHERDVPYIREPLTAKVSDLASQFPDLKSLRSCDLLPSSWFSVAWYPIYRIPTGPSLKDLDACFLTYHFLHTPLKGPDGVQAPIVLQPGEADGVSKISLPVFGLASYKFRGSLWTPSGGYERQLANSLLQEAGNWLRLVRVNHPDFMFFSRR